MEWLQEALNSQHSFDCCVCGMLLHRLELERTSLQPLTMLMMLSPESLKGADTTSFWMPMSKYGWHMAVVR